MARSTRRAAPAASYSKPASQLDLEARQDENYSPPSRVKKGVDPQPSNDGFVGTDQIYKSRANYTDMPIKAEGGAEAKVFDSQYSDQPSFPAPPVEDEVEESGGSDEPPPAETPPAN
jgi:hypothetical protein